MALYESMFAPKRTSALYQPMFATSAAPTGAPPPDEGGGGPFGFVGNLAGEAKDIVTGLGTLVGAGIHDVGRGIGQGLPGRQDWGIIADNPADQYLTDDIATQLPGAIVADIQERYGPLVRGDIGGFAEQLYERPLSFGLDALAVGAGVSKGAQLARRAGIESSALDRFLPQETARLVGTEVQRGLRTGNPVRAFAFERPFDRFATRPISELEADVGALQAVVDTGYALPAQQAELSRLTAQLRAATEGGVTRIYKPAFENRLLRKISDRLIGAHFQAGLKARDEDLAAIRETLEPLAAEGITDDLAEAEFQRLAVGGQETWGPQFLPETRVLDEATGVPKRVYHGTPEGFEGEFDIGKSPGGMYGRGFYFTEDPKIASGYAKGDMVAGLRGIDEATKATLVRRVDEDLRDMYSPPSAPEGWHAWADFEQDRALSWLDDYATGRNGPQLLELLMEQPYNVPIRKIVDDMGLGPAGSAVRHAHLDIRRPFDIDERVPPEAEAQIIGAATEVLQEGIVSPHMGSLPRVLQLGEIEVTATIRKVTELLRSKPGFPPFGERVFDDLKTAVGEDGARTILQRAGYDGITHIGGKVSGGKAHRVWIAFEPAQVRAPWMEATQFGARQAEPGNISPASAAEIGTASRLSREAANRGSIATQAPSEGLQPSSGLSGASEVVRSRSPLAFQYLGPEATISRAHAPFHPYSNTQALLDAAEPAQVELRQVLDQVFGPEAVIGSRIKGAESLTRKLEHKALAARVLHGIDASPESFLPTVTDGVGARVQIGSWSEVASKLDQLRQGGLQILELDDFIRSPQRSGYRGVHATVQLPSGFVGEVQFHTPLSARMAHAGHPSYEVLRNLEKDALDLKAAGEAIPADLERSLALTEAYVRRFQEPVLREMEEQLRGRPMSTSDRVMENTRLLVQERLTNPMIERGLLTPAEAFERSYVPLRVADGAKYDYKAGGFVGGRDVLELDQMLDAQGISAPIYFPHVDVRKVNFSDFISLSKGRIGARRATRPRYAERNTGYLVEKGLYNTNPLEAYSRRAAQAVRFEETYRFVNDVAQRFGRRISKVDEINPATEAVFAPDGLLRFFRQQMHVRDAVADIRAAALSEDEHLAAALKSVLEPVQDEIGAVVTREGVGVTTKGLEMYAIPKAVADRLEAHVRPLLGPTIERNLRLFWDTPTNAWRGFVLTGSPRWVVNNTLGNILFSKMQGARLRDVVAQLDKRFLAKMKEIPGIEQVEQGGLFGASSQYLAKRGSANLTKTGQLLEAGSQLGAVRKIKSAGERVRWFNGTIEDAFRRASYLRGVERAQLRGQMRSAGVHFEGGMRRLERIARSGADDRVVRQGLDEVNYFFNDYTAATPFGRQIIRRFIAPFWSFYRHVAKLAVTWPVDYPLRAEVLKGLTMVTNDMVEEYGPLPPWAEGALPLGPGAEPGAIQFLSTRGANPFNTLFEAPISLLHPAWKIAFEQSTGRSSFTGREFSSADVITPFGSDQQFQIIRDDLGRPIDAVPIERVTPSIGEHLLQQFPQYELAKDVAAGGATYSSADLLDILAGEGVIRDEFGQPLYPVNTAQKLAGYAGAPVFETNLDEYQTELEEDRLQAIATALSRSGG